MPVTHGNDKYFSPLAPMTGTAIHIMVAEKAMRGNARA
jgi:hypothetical protein